MNSHLKKYSPLFKQEGVTRDERYLPALNPDNIPIDDRKLQDLLLYIQQYSAHLLFFDTGEDNAAAAATNADAPKTWADVLKNDSSLLAANIAACPLQEIRQVFELLQMQFDQQRDISSFLRLQEHVLLMYKRIDEWYSTAAGGVQTTSLQNDFQSLIQSHLSAKLETLLQIGLHTRHMAAELDIEAPAVPVWINRGEVWGNLKQAGDRSAGHRIFAGRDEEDKLLNAEIRLKEIFDTAWHVTSQLVESCTAYLRESLYARKDHQPHIGLLITFLELFAYAQNAINRIPQKHLDYYYREVLNLDARKAVADRAFVCFLLEKDYKDAGIKRGTALLAGKDRTNKDRVYVTEKDIVVNTAKIRSVHSLYIQKDRNKEVLQYYTDAAGDANRPLFGDRSGLPGGQSGFAIASPQLYLTRGERKVTIVFDLEKDIPIAKFDTGILELQLTGEEGWLSSERATDGVLAPAIARTGDRKLELSFTVSISQPSAIIAFDPTLHEGDFSAAAPVLQCLLKYPLPPKGNDSTALIAWQNRIIQLNSLRKIRPLHTSITVQVGDIDAAISFDGVRELSLQNHETLLDAKKPFFPFTSNPKVGSSFYIGCKDLYYKPIQRLNLNIEWMLPDRFRSYYDRYLPPYDSNKFMASLSILYKKKWKKINDIPLIDTDSVDPRWRSMKIDPAKARTEETDDNAGSIGRFDTSKKDGMLKLKLNYPDFGHSVYAQLVTSTVMAKADPHKKKTPDFYEMVKQQLHDSVISIKLPPDLASKTGPFKVIIYEVAASRKTDDEARTMMVKGLSILIRNFNGSGVRLGTTGGTTVGATGGAAAGTAASTASSESGQRVIVNDDNFIERIFGFLRRIKVLSGETHYDKDKQDVGDIVENVKERIEPRANFVLPADKELVRLIIDVTNSAIDQTVVKIADAIIALRQKGIDEQAVADIFRKEFDEANEVLNDMIAAKVATMLQSSEIPPPPYTPQINMISLSYLSSRRLTAEDDAFYRIDPFFTTQVDPGGILFDERILHGPEGLLFIGIGDCRPGQLLSLLFRFAEGSGRTDAAPPPISWQYLCGKEWVKLPETCLVSDGTYGLQASGILQISLPDAGLISDESPAHTGSYRICAAVERDTDAFPCLIDVIPNCVTAVFANNGNDPAHAGLPLPAGSINRLQDKIPAIKKVDQPLASFDGRMAEDPAGFYTRVSERLRHKSRAIDNWDYEHLVLEHFPEVYKVKCLNDYRDGKFTRGHVTIVPIGDLRNKEHSGINLLIPRVGYTLLRGIERYLRTLASPFVKIHAVNPELSRVEISARVKFGPTVDKGYALKKLDSDLLGLLTPWAAGGSGALSFSAKIYASNVMSFIDGLDYVDYVEDLEMRQYSLDREGEKIYVRNAGQGISLVETQFVSGHAVLISAPAHELVSID